MHYSLLLSSLIREEQGVLAERLTLLELDGLLQATVLIDSLIAIILDLRREDVSTITGIVQSYHPFSELVVLYILAVLSLGLELQMCSVVLQREAKPLLDV